MHAGIVAEARTENPDVKYQSLIGLEPGIGLAEILEAAHQPARSGDQITASATSATVSALKPAAGAAPAGLRAAAFVHQAY